jgi:muramoyltetrapeptide carboxypeptidase LdcA involved in peptidoglycan recycling
MSVDPSNKRELIEMAFEYMRAGSTINHAALQCGYSPATFWRWLHEDQGLLKSYEQLKVARSRALIEHVIYEMQEAVTLEQVKCAERRAKYYILVAAKLNPTEFSDRMHSPTGKGTLGGGNTTFVLNFANTSAQPSRELVSVTLPEDE